MSKYTAEDFANAEFARHPDGRIAARLYPGLKVQWTMFESAWGSSDHRMAIDNWVPVPDQAPGRTITASEFDEAVESCITEDATVPPHKFAERLGVVCVPDPEPPESVAGRTITRSHYQNIIDETSVPYGVGFTDGFHQAGGSIIDDPEPTEAEKLAKIISEYTYNSEPQALAEALVRAGVKAPEGES